MSINSKTATTAIALMIAAGAYPIVGIAQDTTSDSDDGVQVEVIESDDNADVTGDTETGADAADRTGDETGTSAGNASGNVDIDQDATSSDSGTKADSSTTSGSSSSADQDSTTSTGSTSESGTSTDTTTGTATVTDTDGGTTSDQVDTVPTDDADRTVVTSQEAAPEGMVLESQRDNQWLSTDLTNKNVENPEGEKIGSVGGIIFSDDGPDGIIVEVGGFLGIGQKNVALRWSDLNITDDAIIVNATKDELKEAPEFVSLKDQGREADGTGLDNTASMGTGSVDGQPADGTVTTPEQNTVP